MTDYVVYQKTELLDDDAFDLDKLAIYTKKPVLAVLGSRVWLIAGEGWPRQYRLCATFLIGGISPSDKPGFMTLVSGKDPQFLDPMPLLNDQPWFPKFVVQQGRFAFGFNRIRNTAAESGLRAVLRTHSLR